MNEYGTNEVARMQAEIDRLRAENDQLKNALDRIAQSNGLASWHQLVDEDSGILDKKAKEQAQ